MSTAPDPRFPDLPGLIFGFSPSQHRRSSMKRLLRRYNVQVRGNDRKEDTLGKLLELEKSLGEREKEALVNWFAGENSCRALAALLGDALKPPITPKIIDQPASKKAKLEEPEDEVLFAAVNECRICMETLAPENFPQSRITSTCAHHPAVCCQCLTTHINIQLQTKASDKILCPECPEKVSDAEIKSYASPEVLERTGRRTFIVSLQHLPNFTFCLSPTCESGQIHTGADQPMMTCTTCNFKTCFIHKLPWHEDLTCAEFDIFNQARIRQEAASEAWIIQHARLCPNPECGMRIQKKTGCDHLICECDYCLFEFCWCCCADFRTIKRQGNDGHKEHCQWHTSNKNGMPGYGRRREPAPKRPKEAKDPKKSKQSKNPKLSDADPAPERLNILIGLKQMDEPITPEERKQSHATVEPHKTANGMEPYRREASDDDKHSPEPDVPECLENSIGLQEPTESGGTTQRNPLKRSRDE
ncbi:6f4d0a23-bb51-45b0-9679-f96c73812993 [Sclerotinia trifoliorum]|uniref:RBR-type E3 ubiquitin transferase n=1 Tax=Sclerotinia trifoliorum TaxID=28548 RepID=A0A8H2ZR85_9HELO|nr:6f4d0a23-bb51-45b0-9679-f96c73812993 [Sclerotinia trifoliorum]